MAAGLVCLQRVRGGEGGLLVSWRAAVARLWVAALGGRKQHEQLLAGDMAAWQAGLQWGPGLAGVGGVQWVGCSLLHWRSTAVGG